VLNTDARFQQRAQFTGAEYLRGIALNKRHPFLNVHRRSLADRSDAC
jgi:hypothetical protein